METYTCDGYSRCPYGSMYHGVIREHWERINKFLYCLHLPSILQKVVWSAVKHLSTFKNKKTTTKTNISTSKQGLEIELLKFKSLQDANETCRVQAVLDDRVSGHNILNRWILFSQKGRQRYLVVIIIDCIGTCLSGSLYSMAERQGQEKLHHFGLEKAFPTQNIYNIFNDNYHYFHCYTTVQTKISKLIRRKYLYKYIFVNQMIQRTPATGAYEPFDWWKSTSKWCWFRSLHISEKR